MTRDIDYPQFTSKSTGETVTLSFNFSRLVSAPLTPSVTVTRHAGPADATPSSILHGSPQISGTKILQQVTDGVDGVDYLLVCSVDTVAGDHYELPAILPVRQTSP